MDPNTTFLTVSVDATGNVNIHVGGPRSDDKVTLLGLLALAQGIVSTAQPQQVGPKLAIANGPLPQANGRHR